MARRSMTLPDLGGQAEAVVSLHSPLPHPRSAPPTPSFLPHQVAAGRLLVGEGLGAAQAGLVPFHQVPDGWATGAALAGQGPGLRGRVGHTGRELQLQFHVLAQLGGGESRDAGEH